MSEMFCYQCEQTAGGTGCTLRGVCGKTAETAREQDALTEALVRFAVTKKMKGGPLTDNQAKVLVDGLFTCVTNVNFDPWSIRLLRTAVDAETGWICGNGPCREFRLRSVWDEPPETRALKSLLLFGLRGMAAYAHHAAVLGHRLEDVDGFFVTGLVALAEAKSVEDLKSLVLELGKVNGRCMGLLDGAHRGTFGRPTPACVPLAVEPGAFVVVTGHDLLDLKMLLEQTNGAGVDVYTHGEMLPAHGYPELKRHRQLKGHYGTAWQNQQREFDELPAPILWTTNCLMPPRPSYSDRVWTTGVVHHPGVHVVPEVRGNKDFSGLIAQAHELGGWPVRRAFTGVNGGMKVWTGFGHESILADADRIVAVVKKGRIRRFLLVGGCDGARPGRNYYTELVRQAPKDWIVLTLACGKFRFNDLELGEIEGIPRLLDLGQCNDAHGAIQVALALAKAFGCGVNDLPLSVVLSWYEQKAVAVLLTLLAYGIRNIRLGPTSPAFASLGLLEALGIGFGIRAISDPATDLAEMAR